MPELQIYNLDNLDTLITNLTEGEHVFGRGPLLKCEDRRVSRNHGLFKIQNDDITITSIHQNPCFFQSSDSTTITILPKNNPIHVKSGDKFALLADKFWYKVKVVNTTEHRDVCSPLKETNGNRSEKRKIDKTPDSSSAKRSKPENNGDFSFSESSNDSMDFAKLHDNSVKNNNTLESPNTSNNNETGDNSNDSIDFLKLSEISNNQQSKDEKEQNVITDTNDSFDFLAIGNNNGDGDMQTNLEHNVPGSSKEGGMQSATSTNVLEMDNHDDELQAMKDILFDLKAQNEPLQLKNQTDNQSKQQSKKEVVSDSDEEDALLNPVDRNDLIQPKKEVLSEDEIDSIDFFTLNTASSSGGGIPKKEIVSDSEDENAGVKTNKKLIKKEKQDDLAHQEKLKAMLDSSDEEVNVEQASEDQIPQSENNQNTEVKIETKDTIKIENNDLSGATTSGTNPRIFRERCWYGASCYRKNSDHLRQLSHPGDTDYETDAEDDRPVCVYGGSCYRRNADHRKEYRHPKVNNNDDGNNTKKKKEKPVLPKKRAPAKKYNESSEDDYDLQDPFIDDSGSEFEADSVSEDSTDSEFSNGDTEENKRLVKESKRFLKRNKKDG